MNLEDKSPLQEDAIYRMYSSSKLVTSVALMMLYEQGHFNLDDPLLENIKEEILHIDIDTLTPVEALMKLNEIKRMLAKEKRA